MEEPASTDQKTPTQPPTGRFMDIQSPSGNAPTEQSAGEEAPQVAISPDGQLTEAGATTSAESAPVAGTTVAPQTSSAVTVPVGDASPAEEKPAEPEQPAAPATEASHDDHQPEEHPPVPPKPHHSAPLAAIIVAIIVTLGLCGLVIFAYLKSKNTTKIGTTNTPAASQQPVAKPQASPEDVDQVSSSIDQSLSSLDDAADFSANNISDQTLGIQ